jgi:hypothetical protein
MLARDPMPKAAFERRLRDDPDFARALTSGCASLTSGIPPGRTARSGCQCSRSKLGLRRRPTPRPRATFFEARTERHITATSLQPAYAPSWPHLLVIIASASRSLIPDQQRWIDLTQHGCAFGVGGRAVDADARVVSMRRRELRARARCYQRHALRHPLADGGDGAPHSSGRRGRVRGRRPIGASPVEPPGLAWPGHPPAGRRTVRLSRPLARRAPPRGARLVSCSRTWGTGPSMSGRHSVQVRVVPRARREP